MTKRAREVVAAHSTYYVCDVHGWDFTNVDDDVCPVCLGETTERERVIKLLESRTNDSGSVLDETGNSIADLSDLTILIKGEHNG